jgi:hypothetical protein
MKEAKTTSRVGFTKDNRFTIFVNGEPLPYIAYYDTMTAFTPVYPDESHWTQRIRDFINSGVNHFAIAPRPYDEALLYQGETGDGGNVIPLNRQAEIILGLDPSAKLTVRFNDWLPDEWYDANPCEKQTPTTDGLDLRNKPSMASQKGLDDLCKRFEQLISYCESKPWANRVISYHYLPHGEGVSYINIEGYFYDGSAVMQEAFKNWVRRNYMDESTLREAWGENGVTFDAVRVPDDDEWKREIKKYMHWPEGNEMRRMKDYLRLQRELYLNWYREIIRRVNAALQKRPVIFGVDFAKQVMMGWQLNLAFWGIGPGAEYPNIIAATGAIDIGEILDEPGLDMLVTPADYTARTVGYGWEPEGTADSMLLRGKGMYVENDSRTFNEGQENETLGTFNTVPELQAGLVRNAAWSLTRNHMDYWALGGGKYYRNDLVQEQGIRYTRPLYDIAPSLPHVETEHAIAMIIDDSSPLHENGTSGYQNLALIWQRVIGLSHCGIPYRIYLFSDLEKENMPDYRCYLFPNLFQLDEKRMNILQRKVFRDGRMSIFGPSTGITDGKNLSGEWASRVLGVKMELDRKQTPRRVIVNGCHPIVKNIPASMVYGDSLSYGPILIPERDAVENAGGIELGKATVHWFINKPGLFAKDHGTHKIAWSVAVPLPGSLLRELARFGGCHVWCEEDDVVFASGSIASIHTAKAGKRILKLPSAFNVKDLMTGEDLGSGLHEITMEMSSPETRVFQLL